MRRPKETWVGGSATRRSANGAAIGPCSRIIGGVMPFWTEAQMASIDKMLNPRSIAIVGATPRMQYGGRVLAAALNAKDRIRGYSLNPRSEEIMGGKYYPIVTDLPEGTDA